MAQSIEDILRYYGVQQPTQTPALPPPITYDQLMRQGPLGEAYRSLPRSNEEMIAHVLPILALLDRPRNALAVGTGNLLDQNPNTGFFQGLKEGITEQKFRHWADLLGIGRPEGNQGWPEWLARTAAHTGGDIMLDPMIALGWAGRGLRALPKVREAADWIYGTSAGRFLPEVPMHHAEGFMGKYQEAARMRNERMEPVMKMMGDVKQAESSARADYLERLMDVDPELAEEAAKRGATQKWYMNMRQNYERPFLEEGLPPDVKNAYDVMHEAAATALDRLNTERVALGLAPKQKITEDELYRWIPRVLTSKGKRLLKKAGIADAGKTLSLTPEEAVSQRQLALWVDPQAYNMGQLEHLGPEGKPYISIPGYRYSKVKQLDPRMGEGAGWQYHETPEAPGVPAQPAQATLKEIQDSGIAKRRHWMGGVGESYAANIMAKENQGVFLHFLQQGKTTIEDYKKLGKGWLMKRAEPSEIPKGWEQLKVPGLEDYVAPKWAARKLEIYSKSMFNPNTPLGMLEDAVGSLAKSPLGALFRDATQWWKNNVLVHPGFFMANAVSNPGLMASEVSPFLIPFRMGQALAIRLAERTKVFGRMKPVIKGMTNKQLDNEFMRRDLGRAGQYGAEAVTDKFQRAMQGPKRLESLAERFGDTPVAGQATQGIAKIGDLWGRGNQWMFRTFGDSIETNTRYGIAIDWLKKNVKGRIPTAKELDRAAYIANRAAINYHNLTPGERLITNIMPFYAWNRGILGRTVELMATHPEKLANMGRMLDAAFDPLAGRNFQIAPDWIQENMPIAGVAGRSIDQWMKQLFGAKGMKQGPRVFLGGRFNPYGTVQQMVNRPGQYGLGALNPWGKAPVELLRNYSTYMQQPIDKIIGFPENVYNPILSGLGLGYFPYSKSSRTLFGQHIPAAWDFMISQSPAGRDIQEAHELGRGFGLWNDPYRLQMSWPETLAWYGSGGKFYPFEIQKYAKRKRWEYKEKMMNIRSKYKWALKKHDYKGAQYYREMMKAQMQEQRKALSFIQSP